MGRGEEGCSSKQSAPAGEAPGPAAGRAAFWRRQGVCVSRGAGSGAGRGEQAATAAGVSAAAQGAAERAADPPKGAQRQQAAGAGGSTPASADKGSAAQPAAGTPAGEEKRLSPAEKRAADADRRRQADAKIAEDIVRLPCSRLAPCPLLVHCPPPLAHTHQQHAPSLQPKPSLFPSYAPHTHTHTHTHRERERESLVYFISRFSCVFVHVSLWLHVSSMVDLFTSICVDDASSV